MVASLLTSLSRVEIEILCLPLTSKFKAPQHSLNATPADDRVANEPSHQAHRVSCPLPLWIGVARLAYRFRRPRGRALAGVALLSAKNSTIGIRSVVARS